jgi:hypothetical protein
MVVGPRLHQLEYRPSIFLLDRCYVKSRHAELWTLRSDEFPREWDGCAVRIVMDDDDRLTFMLER